MQHVLFVYGTLRCGEMNHRYLSKASFLREALTVPGYALYDCGPYPGLVEEVAGEGVVMGELYALDDETLEHVDALEQHPTFYLRNGISLADGTRAETYLLRPDQVDGWTRIANGDWCRRHD